MFYPFKFDSLVVSSGIGTAITKEGASGFDYVTATILPEDLKSSFELTRNNGGVLDLSVTVGEAGFTTTRQQRTDLEGIMKKLFALSGTWYLGQVDVTLTSMSGRSTTPKVPLIHTVDNRVGTYLLENWQLPVGFSEFQPNNNLWNVISQFGFMAMEVREALDTPVVKIESSILPEMSLKLVPITDLGMYATWSRLRILMNYSKHIVSHTA